MYTILGDLALNVLQLRTALAIIEKSLKNPHFAKNTDYIDLKASSDAYMRKFGFHLDYED